MRTIKYQMTNDMKSRINQYQTLCDDLIHKFNTRVAIETNDNVNQLSTSWLDGHFRHYLPSLQPRKWRRSSELLMTIRSVCRSWSVFWSIKSLTIIFFQLIISATGFPPLIHRPTTTRREKSIKIKPARGLFKARHSTSGKRKPTSCYGFAEKVSFISQSVIIY